MKRVLILLLALSIMFCSCGCYLKKSETLPLPKETLEFTFQSGVGAWVTVLSLNKDGTFVGNYHNSDMGDTGYDYPNGTEYVCSFSGRFDNFEKINDYSYTMTLAELKTETEETKEWIEGEIRYIASSPYGIDEGNRFILYLPQTPTSDVPEEFLSWWPHFFTPQEERPDTLSCYGILNLSTNYGFFSE